MPVKVVLTCMLCGTQIILPDNWEGDTYNLKCPICLESKWEVNNDEEMKGVGG